MKKKPLVSVVTITYNHEKYIREALESFVNQDVNFAFEVLIADDCSTDSTADIIKEFATKYPNVVMPILRKKNIGAVANFLDTLKRATGKYVALCDGDDFWTDSTKLQQQVDFLEKNPDYAISFHPTKVFFENREKNEAIWPSINERTKITVKELLEENFIPTNAVMYRRQNYDDLADDVMPLDWYLHSYHAKFGKIGFINKVMSSYRRHSTGLWWDSFGSNDKLMMKYGVSNTAMYVELLKLYNDTPELRDVIYRGIARLLNNITDVDERNSSSILKELAKGYSKDADVFVRSAHLDKMDDRLIIEDKDKEIERLNQDIIGLREQQFKLRDELHTLKNSRVVGKIIKFRKYVGELIPRIKRLPRRILNKIKAIISSLLPEIVKKVLRRLRHYGRRTENYYHERQLVTETVTNHAWKAGAPLVSVIIPYYNRADTIDDTLNSLDTQTFRDFEVIIVDDGSPDTESIQKLKEVKNTGFKATFIRQENQGVAAARNNGISRAKGKYIICLDSDDVIEPTFIEKSTLVLESAPDVSLVTTNRTDFGVLTEVTKYSPYNPINLYSDNMVITAAEFRKEAWSISGGYKSNIGYEDWDFWLTLAENGFWGKSLPETLFTYRTSMQSRYVEDKDIHWNNMKTIKSLHPEYKKNIKKLLAKRQYSKYVIEPKSAFVNLDDSKSYSEIEAHKPNVLITVPWMTFGGAETLIYNYCREIKDQFNISFVTGLQSEHEWEHKFKEITPNVYHLYNLFGEDKNLHLEFLSNYIATRKIDIVNIIHNGFTFEFLAELKRRHPNLKVVTTMFNDRVEYFKQSIGYEDYIDSFVSDNMAVAKHYERELTKEIPANVIPNGINCFDEFSPDLFDREQKRKELGLEKDDLAVFFVGRLSVEKNPDVFVNVAEKVGSNKKHKVKFFVIGDGPMRPEVDKLIEESKSAQLTYLGYQSEVALYLSAADVFVLPSSIEGFPLSILEALAMRVVVVASDVGAISDVIDNTKDGFVVTPGSVPEIVKAVEILSQDKKLLNDMKDKSRKKAVELYSNKALGRNYANLYKGLLE